MPINKPDQKKEDYNSEPVAYCKHCHSLHIIVDESMAFAGWDGSYCVDCRSTSIGECTIEEWLEEEEKRKATANRKQYWRK